jgi:hypothetical protein
MNLIDDKLCDAKQNIIFICINIIVVSCMAGVKWPFITFI